MELPKDVTEKIKKMIKESGYSQQGFAKKFELGASSISKWMSGSRNPSLVSLKKIAVVTGKPLNYFFDFDKVENIQAVNTTYGEKTEFNNTQEEREFSKKENDAIECEKMRTRLLIIEKNQDVILTKLELILEKLDNMKHKNS